MDAADRLAEVPQKYRVSDEYWALVEPLIPPVGPKKKSGRPRMDNRVAFQAMFYLLRTGMQWNALPKSIGASTTVYRRFREWREAGLFEALWIQALLDFDEKKGLDLRWQSADGVMTKAPLGGEKNGTKSHGSRQARNEAKLARRRARPSHRGRRGPRQRK